MRIKNLFLTSTFALSLIGASVGFASQNTTTTHPPIAPPKKTHKSGIDLLSSKQHAELHAILQSMREQMVPLLKEKRVLRRQLLGKIATKNTQWKDIAPLVNRINAINANITILFAQTRLTTFQKLGVLLPSFNEKRFHQDQQESGSKHSYV